MEEMEAQQKLDADGSLYALQMAQSTLTERYAKMTRKFEANQKSLEHAIRCLVLMFNDIWNSLYFIPFFSYFKFQYTTSVDFEEIL